MFDGKNHGKIKKCKNIVFANRTFSIDYEIVYRAGEFNTAPDVFPRMYCAEISLNQLYEVYSNLCHPGVIQMYHYVRTKNLPYSLEEVRKMTAFCKICAEVKPRFYKLPEMHVIMATKRLSNDFKDPIGNLNRTSVYNPSVNGQCEKHNDVIWYGVKLALKLRNWPLSKWDLVLIDVLHSIRSLPCTATGPPTSERFLTFNRRSTLGTSAPSRLFLLDLSC